MCGSRHMGEDEPSLHQQQNEVFQSSPLSVDVAISQSSHQLGITSFDPSGYSLVLGLDFILDLFEYNLMCRWKEVNQVYQDSVYKKFGDHPCINHILLRT